MTRKEKVQKINDLLRILSEEIEKEVETGSLDQFDPLTIIDSAVTTIKISHALQQQGYSPQEVIEILKSGDLTKLESDDKLESKKTTIKAAKTDPTYH